MRERLELLAQQYYELIKAKKFGKARKFLLEQDQDTIKYIVNYKTNPEYDKKTQNKDTYQKLRTFLKDLERRTIN